MLRSSRRSRFFLPEPHVIGRDSRGFIILLVAQDRAVDPRDEGSQGWPAR